ncbi:MAG: hypothetical protein ACFCBW_15840 [Candidatus Competibacterales bacterium]
MRGIFYRSDTRDPQSNSIFTDGFKKRDTSYDNPTMRAPTPMGNGINKAPDLESSSGVCVTRDFFAAPIFPVGDSTKQNCSTWVYIVDLDVSKIFNTQAVQWEFVKSQVGTTASDVKEALWPMYGQERAVNAIAASDIVGAVYVERSFPGNFCQGGQFVCTEYKANAKYTGGQATAVASVMNGYVAQFNQAPWMKPHKTPTQAKGVVKSQKK